MKDVKIIIVLLLTLIFVNKPCEAKRNKYLDEYIEILKKSGIDDIIIKNKYKYNEFKEFFKIIESDEKIELETLLDILANVQLKALKIVKEELSKDTINSENALKFLKILYYISEGTRYLSGEKKEDEKLNKMYKDGFHISYDYLIRPEVPGKIKIELLKWLALFGMRKNSFGLIKTYAVIESYIGEEPALDLKELPLPKKEDLEFELYDKAELIKIQADILELLKKNKEVIGEYNSKYPSSSKIFRLLTKNEMIMGLYIKSFYFDILSRGDVEFLETILESLKKYNLPDKFILNLENRIKILDKKSDEVIKFYQNQNKDYKMNKFDYITLSLAYYKKFEIDDDTKYLDIMLNYLKEINEEELKDMEDIKEIIYEIEFYYFFYGGCHYAKNDYNKAKIFFEKNKLYAKSKLLLAGILFNEKNYTEAERVIMELIKLSPSYKNNSDIIKMNIVINAVKENFQNIVELYERENAKKIFDEHPLLLTIALIAYGKIDNKKGLSEILLKLMKLHPDSIILKIIEKEIEKENKEANKYFQELKNLLKEMELKKIDINELFDYFSKTEKDKEKKETEKETQDKQKIETESEN